MKKPGKEEPDRILFFSDPPPRRRKSLHLYVCACIVVFLVLGSFIGWYHYSYPYSMFDFSHDINHRLKPICSDIPNTQKYDCHPEDGSTEETCRARGCCYQELNYPVNRDIGFPPLNVPYCYYPENYEGYSISHITQDGRHIAAKLKRGSTPSGFPNDVQNLDLLITFIDDFKLRIKITDQDKDRFEVPIPVNIKNGNLLTPTFSLSLDSKSGKLTITRKTSGTVIFQTELSRLVYADQFLQFSNDLPSPYLYGIGEHYGTLLRNMNWTRFTLFNVDLAPIPNHNLYGSHPFYMSMEKDGNANGVFLLNSNSMDVILQPTPAITYRPIGGILDFFVLLGPTPASVVQQYTDIMGRSSMPPYWSLGFHLCRYGYNSLNKTKEVMERTINATIPLDVQWNDIDYMERYKDFTYDKDTFAGLPEFVDMLHKEGRHYVIMTDPGISNSEKPGTYPPYEDGLKSDVFIKNPNGTLFIGKVWTDGLLVFPDFSHPNATSYWSEQFQNFHKEVKYDGVWIDMNEPSNFNNGGIDGCISSSYEDPPYLPGGKDILRTKTVCMTAKHYKTIHYNEHNLYGYREAAATNQALRDARPGKRPFIISRATFPGQQVNSGHWSGDISSSWEDMRYTIPSMLNFNIYGMSMVGSDICGFNFNTTVELCARWQALGSFYPFSRNHNERVTIEQDPVALGKVVVEATRKALTIRYSLLPYLYTLFYRSNAFGDTVARPLFFEFPLDNQTYHIDEQFLWGSSIMIMPALYESTSSINVYIPKGIWYNRLGAQLKTGSLPAGLTDYINIAFRGGYIVPLQVPGLSTTESRKNAFVLAVMLDENNVASGELYWDDGDVLDAYENGTYNLISFSAYQNSFKSEARKHGFETQMPVVVAQVFGLNKEPTEVTVNGVKCIKHIREPDDIEFDLFSLKKDFQAVSQDEYCSYGYNIFQIDGLYVGMTNATLLSPLTITWK